MANELKQIYGTAQTVISTAVDIANGNFSGAPTEFDNTTDAVVPNAPWATVMGEFPDWAAAPTARSTVDFYMVRKNTDGTDDDTGAPSGTSLGGAELVGSFVLYATDELQRRTFVISLLGVLAADFYIMNNSGQNLNNDAGTSCIVKITPFTFKPI